MEKLDEKYTRITSILAPFSGLSRISPAVLENAANRGTRVHVAIDSIINGIGFDLDEEIAGYVESFEKWRGDKVFIPNPKRFYNDEHMITGEADAIYATTLVDFKTSAKEGSCWVHQGSAYCKMAHDAGYKIDKIEFVQLRKDGKVAKSYFYEYNFEEFLRLKNVYDKYFKTKQTQEEMDYEYI